MTIPRANALGWAAFELLTSAQMNTVDIHTTEAVDGVAGGLYALQTVGGRGDGYITLDATLATATPGSSTGVLHLIRPEGVASNLASLLVTQDDVNSNNGIALGVFTYEGGTTTATGTHNALTASAAGTGTGVEAVGGGGTGTPGTTGGRAISAQGGPDIEAIRSTGGLGGMAIDATGGAADAAESVAAGQGIRAEGGASATAERRNGPGVDGFGGDYSGGDYTGATPSPEDVGHGVVGTGGNANDTVFEFELTLFSDTDITMVGTGGLFIGGQGTAASVRGGIGVMGIGTDGGANGASRTGGSGGVFIGSGSLTGSGAIGIYGVGGTLAAANVNVAGASGGSGARLYGGAAETNVAEISAGDGVIGTGGNNDNATGAAGDGVVGVGGTAGSGLLFGAGVRGSTPSSAIATVSNNSYTTAQGVGVYGQGSTNQASIAVAGRSSPAIGGGGAYGLGVYGISRGPAGAGVRGEAGPEATTAVGLDAVIDLATNTRGHISGNASTTEPVTPQDGTLFFSSSLSASLHGSLYTARNTQNGNAARWARVVDDGTPWVCRSWGTVRLNALVATETGLLAATTSITASAFSLNPVVTYDDADFAVSVIENLSKSASAVAPFGRPVVTSKAVGGRATVRLVGPATSAFRSDLNTIDFGVDVIWVGRVNAIF